MGAPVFEAARLRVVAGLGNPGERYRFTRHNAGFQAVELLASRAGTCGRVDLDAWLAEIELGGEHVVLVEPLRYMNLSGVPIARILDATGGSPRDLLVIVDDVALELGVVRVRERGSDGGHNGLRSIAAALGTEEFVRVRVGVRVGELPPDLADYVLAEVPPEDRPAFASAVSLAADAASCVLREGTTVAMNRFNSRKA